VAAVQMKSQPSVVEFDNQTNGFTSQETFDDDKSGVRRY